MDIPSVDDTARSEDDEYEYNGEAIGTFGTSGVDDEEDVDEDGNEDDDWSSSSGERGEEEEASAVDGWGGGQRASDRRRGKNAVVVLLLLEVKRGGEGRELLRGRDNIWSGVDVCLVGRKLDPFCCFDKDGKGGGDAATSGGSGGGISELGETSFLLYA